MQITRKVSTRSLLFLTFFAVSSAITVQAVARSAAGVIADQIQMKGEYLWTQGGDMTEPLDATFERIEGDRWSATLRFPFEGRRHTWKGEFVGDPLAGTFDGEVTWGRGRHPRRWSVQGTTADGVYRATHTELFRDGRRNRTGSITLRPDSF